MPQFVFSAKDARGNKVEGTVSAANHQIATDQVRQMGYTPVQIEPTAGQGVPAPTLPSAAPDPLTPAPSSFTPYAEAPSAQRTLSGPAPIDLSQPVAPVMGGAIPNRTLLNPEADTTTARMERLEMDTLEPWQRGGPVPQPPAPQTAPQNFVAPANYAPAAAGLEPTQTLPLGTAPANRPAPRPEVARGTERPSGGKIPYGANVVREVSFWQRFKEVMIYPIFAGVVIKDLSAFYRQFSTLINAGLPLYQALVALESNTENGKLKEIARAGMEQVQAGGRFSDVMAAYPWIFSPMQVELVRAAEHGGMLDQVLLQIADYVDHELEIRRLVSRETLYPKIVLFVALMILGRPGFLGGTMAIVNFVLQGDGAQYFRDTLGFGLLCLIPFLAIVALFRLSLFNVKGVRESYDTFKMCIPGLGKLVRMFSLAKFARTFAALYKAGFAMGTALQIAGDACGNSVVRNAARSAIYKAERGELVSDALRSSGVFPSMAADMFRTGETTGNLDEMLNKVADYYESEAKTKSHQVALIFGVAVFLLVAILVGIQVINQYGGLANREMSAGKE